jgi:hypothetical protein
MRVESEFPVEEISVRPQGWSLLPVGGAHKEGRQGSRRRHLEAVDR